MAWQIRPEQFDVFARQRELEADLAQVDHLRKRFPVELGDRTDQQLLPFVGRCRATANEFGLTSEADVALYCVLAVMYEPTFFRQPWAARILRSELSGEQKAERLRERVEASGIDL